MTQSKASPPPAPPVAELIPIPLHIRLQSGFRRFTPFAVFLVVCGVCSLLWGRRLMPTQFTGTVEILTATITSPDDGTLTNIWVRLHEQVKAGATVAELVTTDPRTVNSRLSVMRGRMQLTQLEMSPVLSQQRNALDYAQLTLSGKRLRVEVETAKVNLAKASAEVQRYEKLFENGLISEEALLVYRRVAEAYETEVREKTTLIGEMEKTLERLSFLAESFVPGSENDPLRQALKVQESQTRALEDRIRPLALLAPMDGIITAVHRRRGEQLMAGMPVAEVTSPKAERIIGRLPETFPFTPEVGMRVEVQTRKLHRARGWAQVIGLSPSLQVETNTYGRTSAILPFRPVSISMPTNLALLPGEQVDLFIPKPNP